MSVNFEDLKDLEGFYSSFAESWNSQHRTDEYDPVTHTYKWIVTDEADYQDFINTYNIYHKDGSIVKNGSLIELGENEIMLSKERLNNWFSTDEELQTAISEGLTFDLLDKSYDPIKGLTVVGYFSHNNNYNSQDAVSNDKLKEYIKAELFTGYDYVIASLTQDEKINKDFVTFCETFSEDTKVKYTVQNSSTGVLDNFGDMFDTLSEVFLYVGIGFAVFASFLLMNFISTSISYKKREIGVLRALGARGTDVFGIFFNESLVIAAINFVLATIATFVAAFFINNAVINDLGFNLVILTVGIRQVVLILGISIIAAFIASLLPVVKIARKKPIDAINNR